MQKEKIAALQTRLCNIHERQKSERIFRSHFPGYSELIYEYDKNVREKVDHSILAFIVHDSGLDDWIDTTERNYACKPFDKQWVRDRTIPLGQWERAIWGHALSCRA